MKPEAAEAAGSTVDPMPATPQLLEQFIDTTFETAPSETNAALVLSKSVERMYERLPEIQQRGFLITTSAFLKSKMPDGSEPENKPLDATEPAPNSIESMSADEFSKAFSSIIMGLRIEDKERITLFQMFVNVIINNGFQENEQRLEFVNWLDTRLASYKPTA